MSVPYHYDPLPSQRSIRLVHLVAGDVADPLRCTVSTTSLDVQPVYEAISYVWGDDHHQECIQICTANGHKQLYITQNLAAALRRFRHPSSDRTLWVDSICINQVDHEEKNVQVPLMGPLYRIARRVLIWLGEGPSSEKAALADACITRMSEARDKVDGIDAQKYKFLPGSTPEWDEVLRIRRFTPDDIHSALGLPPLDSSGFQAVREMLASPWFSRAWTWQESFVAREAIFYRGGKSWDKECLKRVCTTMFHLQTLHGPGNAYGHEFITAIRMLMSETQTENRSLLDIINVLFSGRGAGCKLPNDLVYSVIGAARRCPDIVVDYDQPFEVLFARTTWQIMSERGELSILRSLERHRIRPSDLPTWTPDWRVGVSQKSDTVSISQGVEYFATGFSRTIATMSADCKTLSISGIYFDGIDAVAPEDINDVESWIATKFNSSDLQQSLYGPTGESMEQALRRIYFLDTTSFEAGGDADAVTRWQPNSHSVMDDILKNAASEDQESRIKYGRLVQALLVEGQGRVLFVTDGGRVGMAANVIRSGDVIAMLMGADTPFLLRPIEGSDRYTMVSDCYVHGYMDGESLIEARKAAHPDWHPNDRTWLNAIDQDDIPLQEFHIR